MEKILLFIPCYNCEKELVQVLTSLKSKDYPAEIIVVDNGSKDNTLNTAIDFAKNNKDMPLTVMQNQNNYNLGGSHKVAFQYAIDNNFDYLIVLHGDNQGDISDIDEIISTNKYKNYDCCLGARFMRNSKLINYSPIRILGNIAFNILFSLCLLRPLYDLGGGLNIYSVNMLKSKFYIKYPDALTFNYVMTMANDFYKFNYMFFPLTWKEDGQVSNVNVTKQAFQLFGMLFNYLRNKKSYMNSELRTKIFDEYKSNRIYSFK